MKEDRLKLKEDLKEVLDYVKVRYYINDTTYWLPLLRMTLITKYENKQIDEKI